MALLQQARDLMPKSTALMPQVRTASAAAANISNGYIHSIYNEGSAVKPKLENVTESLSRQSLAQSAGREEQLICYAQTRHMHNSRDKKYTKKPVSEDNQHLQA